VFCVFRFFVNRGQGDVEPCPWALSSPPGILLFLPAGVFLFGGCIRFGGGPLIFRWFCFAFFLLVLSSLSGLVDSSTSLCCNAGGDDSPVVGPRACGVIC